MRKVPTILEISHKNLIDCRNSTALTQKNTISTLVKALWNYRMARIRSVESELEPPIFKPTHKHWHAI